MDELPQFVNVLIGEMSIVGPRPHPTPLNIRSSNEIDRYLLRHLVKPGITGWAQIHGYRGNTQNQELMQKRVEHDIWYIENWSFSLDLSILVLTLLNMVKGDKNAY
jgi:putative colanic acid biosynthesis UDP-glucose lipid carrier transferase